MPTETRPPRTETDEDLLSRAPVHDGVATQRDLRETERYLADRFDAKLDTVNAKIDRINMLYTVGFVAIIALIIAVALRI